MTNDIHHSILEGCSAYFVYLALVVQSTGDVGISPVHTTILMFTPLSFHWIAYKRELPSFLDLNASLATVKHLIATSEFHQTAMVQGRGNAAGHAVVALGVALLCLLIHCELAESAIYTVGGSGGWTFNTVNWPNGKRFRAGDVLVFKYNPTVHNVVAVNGVAYNRCTTPRGSKVFKSGNDRMRLTRGRNYFICNFVGHCQAGMKISVTAT